jgi:hypothetical protein
MLRVIRARKSGKRFVGCQGWVAEDESSCHNTFPLPQRGDVFKLEDRCSVCDQTPRLKVVPPRGRAWNLCLNDDCPSMAEMKRRRAEREEARRAKEEAESAASAAEDDGTSAPAAGGRAVKSKPKSKPKPASAAGGKSAGKRPSGARKPRSPGRQGARGRGARSRAAKN